MKPSSLAQIQLKHDILSRQHDSLAHSLVATSPFPRRKPKESLYLEHLRDHNIKENTGEHLRAACRYGQYRDVCIVLATPEITEATINSTDSNGNTAFHLACRHNEEMCAVMLLSDKRVDVTTQNHKGESPLNWAYQHVMIVTLKEWIDSGRKFDDKSFKQYTHRDFERKSYPVDEMNEMLSKYLPIK